jgi:NitT/TauT family transport system substrate-binding protein
MGNSNRSELHILVKKMHLLWNLSGLAILLLVLITFTASAEEIDLRLGDVSMNKLPFIMAYDEGIFKDNGLDLVPKFTRSSVEIIRRSGVDVPDDFIIGSNSNTPMSVGGAAPAIVRFATRAGATDPLILGSTHFVERWRIVGRPDITSAEQIKGKRIGYSGFGAVSHMAAILFIQAMGWDPQFDVSLMSDALGVEALREGYVDVSIGPELHATMAIDAGFPVIVDLADYNLTAAGSAFQVDREWFEKNPDEARRFVKSAVEAVALLKTNKEAAFRTIRKWYQMDDMELMEHFYEEAAKVPRKPYAPIEGIRAVLKIYDSHEMRKYTAERFINDNFVRELDESGYIDGLYE